MYLQQSVTAFLSSPSGDDVNGMLGKWKSSDLPDQAKVTPPKANIAHA